MTRSGSRYCSACGKPLSEFVLEFIQHLSQEDVSDNRNAMVSGNKKSSALRKTGSLAPNSEDIRCSKRHKCWVASCQAVFGNVSVHEGDNTNYTKERELSSASSSDAHTGKAL